MSRYHHLSINERENILVMKTKGWSLRSMAAALSRSPSTLSRELGRNSPDYSPHVAQENYTRRRPHRPQLLKEEALRRTVERLLGLFWSPEQIENRLRFEGAQTVSYATIYRALDAGLLDSSLRTRLRIKHKPYRKGHGGRTGRIPVERWIDDRPDAANRREEYGHWESDTVLGVSGGAALATHVDRKSRYTIAAFIPRKQSACFVKATIECFRPLPSSLVRSFTVDHGKEFAGYRDIQDSLGANVYFAHVGNPGQRGTNENTNGLLRQWFPKRIDLATFSRRQLDEVLFLLNRRPRKCLGWKSPFELLFNCLLHFT